MPYFFYSQITIGVEGDRRILYWADDYGVPPIIANRNIVHAQGGRDRVRLEGVNDQAVRAQRVRDGLPILPEHEVPTLGFKCANRSCRQRLYSGFQQCLVCDERYTYPTRPRREWLPLVRPTAVREGEPAAASPAAESPPALSPEPAAMEVEAPEVSPQEEEEPDYGGEAEEEAEEGPGDDDAPGGPGGGGAGASAAVEAYGPAAAARRPSPAAAVTVHSGAAASAAAAAHDIEMEARLLRYEGRVHARGPQSKASKHERSCRGIS